MRKRNLRFIHVSSTFHHEFFKEYFKTNFTYLHCMHMFIYIYIILELKSNIRDAKEE